MANVPDAPKSISSGWAAITRAVSADPPFAPRPSGMDPKASKARPSGRRRKEQSVLPSGRQIELASGAQRAVVTEVGAGLRTYTVDGIDVLDGYAAHEMCSGGRGQLLVPWPNRIRDGRYRFAGTDHQTPLSEPERGNAIHGLLRWANWELDQSGRDRVIATHVLHPQVGYPFTLGLEVAYMLSGTGLGVAVTATNLGSEPLPYGLGHHPYFSVSTDLVDAAVLRVPATSVLEADARGIPTGRCSPR